MSQRYKYIFYYQPPISYHVAELIKRSLHIPFIYSFFIVLYLLRGQTWKNKYAIFNDQGTGAAVVDSRVMGTDFIWNIHKWHITMCCKCLNLPINIDILWTPIFDHILKVIQMNMSILCLDVFKHNFQHYHSAILFSCVYWNSSMITTFLNGIISIIEMQFLSLSLHLRF